MAWREREREKGYDGWREGWLGGWRERDGRSKKQTQTNVIQAIAVVRVIIAKTMSPLIPPKEENYTSNN
jgi:hypothetical protein